MPAEAFLVAFVDSVTLKVVGALAASEFPVEQTSPAHQLCVLRVHSATYHEAHATLIKHLANDKSHDWLFPFLRKSTQIEIEQRRP